MAHLIKCARCGASLTDVSEGSVVQPVCGNCHFKFQVICDRLANKSSRQVTLRRQSTRHSGSYYRDYELRIELTDRDLEIVRFSTSGREDRLLARRGDHVTVVHSMRGSQLEELLYIRNLTTGDLLSLAAPGDRANRSATLLGCLVTSVFLAVAAALSQGELQPVFLVVAAILSLLVWRWIHRRMQPTHVLPTDFEESRQRTQTLLDRKQECDLRLASAQDSLEKNEALRARLLSLRRKMLDVGLDLYKPRLAAIDRGLLTLDRQKALDTAVRDGYARAVKMFEIELETGAASDQLQGDIAPVLLSKLDELKSLEERQADLTRELEANAEIDQLLRTRSDS